MTTTIWIGTRKGLFVARQNGAGWEIVDRAFPGVPVTMLLAEPESNRVYAALDHGHFGVKLHRSENGGRDWLEIPAPSYPEKPEGVTDLDPMRHSEIPWDTKMIWSLEPGGREGELWCGTIPGGLFHSRDLGDSWQLVESLWNDPLRKQWFGGGADLPGIHSIAVHPDDPDRVTIAISCGGVWVSEDGGTSWACRADGMRAAYMPPDMADTPNTQDPHRVVQCRAAPEVLWCQHHNGVFLSEDGSRSWRELDDLPPSFFGFSIAVHPNDPDTAWRVPAAKDEERIPVGGRFVVTRTRDRGSSWATLTAGLPAESAYDIVFRHALEVAPDGRCLAIGSTTGSVWASDDQGDTWQTISHHLPPVYCLRVVQ